MLGSHRKVKEREVMQGRKILHAWRTAAGERVMQHLIREEKIFVKHLEW